MTHNVNIIYKTKKKHVLFSIGSPIITLEPVETIINAGSKVILNYQPLQSLIQPHFMVRPKALYPLG